MLVSVIIPVYNTKEYLDQCVHSIVGQSVQDWECILVDDGSTDGTAQKCDEWAMKDSRIKVIHQTNSGVSIARNEGIKVAQGDFLYFIDSDDWCEPNIFEFIGEADMLLGSFFIGRTCIINKAIATYNYPLAFLNDNIRTCIGAFIVKRCVVVEHGIFYEPYRKYAEDLSFILRCMLYAKSIVILDGIVFMHYRQVISSAVHQYDISRFDAYFSRLWLLNDVLSIGNKEVVSYLHTISCVESIVLVTRELFLRGYTVKRIKEYYKSHPVIYITLIRAMKTTSLPSHYANAAKLLVYCPYIYKLQSVLIYKWYDVRAWMGMFKQQMLSK